MVHKVIKKIYCREKNLFCAALKSFILTINSGEKKITLTFSNFCDVKRI